ncbi:MAG: hypothetical protein A3K03_00650 [Bdellovibrionales bacterium RIFOXYD1_FULL_44_7]|nr:MAG: hypothetical protein A3K03_00650 [Bdellovibrionales bacterium RIFOXYD1_FULL_44_7]
MLHFVEFVLLIPKISFFLILMTNSEQCFDRFYDSLARKIFLGWVDIRKQAVITKFFKNRSGLRVLDLGSGTANISSRLVASNKVYAVDQSELLLNQASRRGVITALGSFENIPHPDSYFDVVLMIDSIEHVPSREKAFKEIKRVLKKDSGILLVITPCYNSLLWNLSEWFAVWITKRVSSGHISPFTTESLDYFLKSNFHIVNTNKLNFKMWFWSVASGPKL